MRFLATRLRCEHREDVPLIDDPAPRLGWTLEADGRDRRQSAYRILVASSPGLLGEEVGDLWDSGRVESSRTIEIPYAGLPLPPARELVWSVQVFDETGAASPWAEPARFRTALESWRATWIGFDDSESAGLAVDPGERLDEEGKPGDNYLEGDWSWMFPAPYLRRPFTLERPVVRATLYATARGLVDLELNGDRVGDATLAPGWTDYRQRIEYAAHDVTASLRKGDNVLGAVLGDGWYAGYVGCDRKHAGALYGRDPELLCELHLEFADGGYEVICSEESWCATNAGPIRHGDLQMGERHDARLDIDGWSAPGFDAASWSPVRTAALDGVALVPQRAQPIRVTEELRPVAITEHGEGVRIFDLGQNFTGRARLATEGPRGTEIRLCFGEALDEDGSVYRDNLLSARQTDTFVLRGEGREVFEPRFTFHGFRYVEVTGLAQPADENTLTGCVLHSDLPLTGAFSCSEEMVDQIYRNTLWTQRSNHISVPLDCAQRDERLGWAGDAQLFLPTGSLNMDVAAFMTKWGDDLLDAQSEQGAYPDVAPRIVWLKDGAPGWGDAGVIMPWVIYSRYGDVRILERHWSGMERFMDYVQGANPDFLRRRRRNADYSDWLSIGERVPGEVMATAFWARSAGLMAKIAALLGRSERAAHYDDLAANVVRAFNQAYVGEDGLIEGDTQTGYVLALAFDLLPEELRPRAAELLVANIERRGGRLATGIHGTPLLCQVLTATGHAEVAHRLLLQDTVPSWGHMIRHGATTIWENWDGYTDEDGFRSPLQNSFNHTDFGAIASWLIESVAGIRSEEGRAYERVLIAPVPGELEHARGSYRSVRGEIVSDWSREDGAFRLAVTVPANVAATVLIPAQGGTLSEGGEDAATAPGVRSVVREDGAWRVEVGSGEYAFASSV